MAGSNKSRVNSARETLGSALTSLFVCTSDNFQAYYVTTNSYFMRCSYRALCSRCFIAKTKLWAIIWSECRSRHAKSNMYHFVCIHSTLNEGTWTDGHVL